MESTSPKVLLLTADAALRGQLVDALGAEVSLRAVETAGEAASAAVRETPAVLALDIEVPGGLGFAVRLRASSRDLRIVFLGTPQSSEQSRELLAAGTLVPLEANRAAGAIRNAIRMRGMSTHVERLRRSTGRFDAVRPEDLQTPTESPPPPGSPHGKPDEGEQ